MYKNSLLDPKMDFIFKEIFGNEQEPDILIRFLNGIFQPYSLEKPYSPIVSIKCNDTEIKKACLEEKYSPLYLNATTAKGETLDIELNMQIQPNHNRDMLRHPLYYLDANFTEQVKNGGEFQKLNPAVSVSILNYNVEFIENDRFHNVYRLGNVSTHENLTGLQELHYIELKKMIHCDQDDDLQLFLEFLKDPNSPIVQEKSSELKELSKAKEKLSNLSCDPATKEAFNLREKALKEEANADSARMAQGIEEGFDEVVHQFIVKSIKKGKSKEYILEAYECTEETYQMLYDRVEKEFLD